MLLDICIVGAPKCATSSLFEWLTAHPCIEGPCSDKELFFFMDEAHPLIAGINAHNSSLDDYRSLFPDGDDKLLIEATTHYLYQRNALERLAKVKSPPLLIAIVRDPAERVLSSFQYTKNNLARIDQDVLFSDYVRWYFDREWARIAEAVEQGGSRYVVMRDILFSEYIRFLDPYRKNVSRGDLIVVTFGEVVRKPEKVCKKIVKKVGADPDFYGTYNYPVENPTYKIRSRILHQWARRLNNVVPEGKIKEFMKTGYRKAMMQSRRERKADGKESALRRLGEHFRPYNRRLSETFGIDVRGWW